MLERFVLSCKDDCELSFETRIELSFDRSEHYVAFPVVIIAVPKWIRFPHLKPETNFSVDFVAP